MRGGGVQPEVGPALQALQVHAQALLRMFRNLLGRKSQSSKLCGGSAHAPDQEDHFGAAPPAVVVNEP